eukprot:Gb_23952 [translate_table: standard]
MRVFGAGLPFMICWPTLFAYKIPSLC